MNKKMITENLMESTLYKDNINYEFNSLREFWRVWDIVTLHIVIQKSINRYQDNVIMCLHIPQ